MEINVVKCPRGHHYDGNKYGDDCPICRDEGLSGVPEQDSPEVVSEPKKEKKKLFDWFKQKPEKESRPVEAQPQTAEPESKSKSDENFQDSPTIPVYSQIPSESYENETSKIQPVPDHSSSTSDWLKSGDDDETWSIFQQKQAAGETQALETTQSLTKAIREASANEEGKTLSFFQVEMEKRKEENSVPTDPVVGWCVAVGGAHKGSSFCLYTGRNSIGRNEANRIALTRDSGVSRERQAIIIFEPRKKDFYLQADDSASSLTYLNEDLVMGSVKLSAFDKIEMGNTMLLFIPLCGERFSWEEYM